MLFRSGGGQDGDRTLHAFRAVGVGDVVELEEQDAITSLHLQVVVFVFRKLGGRIDVHPCRHVLVETVVFVDVGGVVSESGYALLTVVLGDALQFFLEVYQLTQGDNVKSLLDLRIRILIQLRLLMFLLKSMV